MLCGKCGHEILKNAAFCPYCGQKAVQAEPGAGEPIYQAAVRGLLKSGNLAVYRDRTEFVISSVQKAVYRYDSLAAVRKGWDSIEFVTEDGRTESCPVGRKNIHEAFLYVEKACKPYFARRKDRLLSQGVRYSFTSSQGLLNEGVLNISADKAEFKARSGKSEIISFRDVRCIRASAGTLDFTLFGEKTRSFAVGKDMKDEVLAFVASAIAPLLAKRREDLLAEGIYFSFTGSDGGTLNVRADQVEYKSQSGQTLRVPYQDVRAVSLRGSFLELALTDGKTKTFSVSDDEGNEILAFVRKAIEPYVAARTVGFDRAFGMDERIEINEKRGVFHVIRQGGREITGEWPLKALTRCVWTERRELNALGSVVSGGLALIKGAAKAAGNQSVSDAEERLSCAGVILTLHTGQREETVIVWFGIFTAGMSRTNKKYGRYLEEWTGFSEYLKSSCPECELVEPVLPEPEPQPSEAAAEAESGEPESAGADLASGAEDIATQQDELGIARYIEGVSRFIGSCATPVTIAFQGNRGSGRKGSVLRMLFNRLTEQYGDNLLWINVRQFYQGESGGGLPVLVGKKLVGQLSDGGNAADILANLAGLVTGAFVSDSSLGKEMVRGLLNKRSADSPEQLQELFEKIVQARTQGENGKVVLFIDGMDRLTPSKTVEMLEAMRDYFDCKGCVFVVAVDYNMVLSGVQERYGRDYDESRGKKFFDELFKMSFRVPAFSYDVQGYVKGRLENIGLRTDDEAELELYVSLIQASVGRDPGSIDRLTASFQLLKNTAEEELCESRYKRLALFALLCMQTRFPEAYDYAIRMKDNVTPEFLAGFCDESMQLWRGEQVSESEREAFQDFGSVFAHIIDMDGEIVISREECRAFAEVLEISSITSK